MVDSTPLIPSSQGKKQGHRVLCCCDSRKAVVLINLIALILYVLALISKGVQGTLNNDIVSIVFYVITILFYLTVMCSAIQFHRCAVIIAIIWMVFIVIWEIYGIIVEGGSIPAEERQATIITFVVILVIQVFVIYAEGVYVSEVGKGIMSRETHDRERYSW